MPPKRCHKKISKKYAFENEIQIKLNKIDFDARNLTEETIDVDITDDEEKINLKNKRVKSNSILTYENDATKDIICDQKPVCIVDPKYQHASNFIDAPETNFKEINLPDVPNNELNELIIPDIDIHEKKKTNYLFENNFDFELTCIKGNLIKLVDTKLINNFDKICLIS